MAFHSAYPLGVCLLWCMAMAAPVAGLAQNQEEWFRQQKTQKKYLMEQLVALEFSFELLAEGTAHSKNHLENWRQALQQEYALHKQAFGGHLGLNPRISGLGDIREMTFLFAQLLEAYPQTIQWIQESPDLSDAEKVYLNQVFTAVLRDMESVLDELLVSLSNNELEVQDAARISSLLTMHQRMRSQYRFFRNFQQQTRLLVISRNKTKQEIIRQKDWVEFPQSQYP